MPTLTEATPAPTADTGAVHECDFCGRAMHRATAVERVQRGGKEPELVQLCVECAFGVD